jgi:para-aminobenzoate synthetase/4-amino-4-deoxychorismate lyase
MNPPVVLLESWSPERNRRSFAFSGFAGELCARRPEEVRPVLEEAARAVKAGRHAAGFIAYEAAPGFDPAFVTHPPGDLPLAWFGLFAGRSAVQPGSLASGGTFEAPAWQPSVTREAYDASVQRIRALIAAGDTYQVNFTFRMRSRFAGDERAFYQHLCRSQRAAYCAYIDMGRFAILSASPELFFSLAPDGFVTARPMKGTRPRGRWPEEDEALAAELRASEKDRAENVMIVDLLRNDLGRVSEVGSVHVPDLWEVERYETVLQMTSTVRSRLRKGLGAVDLIGAIFPCGSITGAPKVRTMQIIAEEEDSPRGVYTGSIGCLSPDGSAQFNVAIRTVVVDRETGMAEFGVGGGITWGSSAAGEYEECAVKARVLTAGRPEFDLLETLLHEPGAGYFLLDRHLARLAASARYFGFRYDEGTVKAALRREAERQPGERLRVRLTLARDGKVNVTSRVPGGEIARPVRAALCTDPVNSSNALLFHKTTFRRPYEERLAKRPDCDDLVLVNERGEVTECCNGNIVAVLDGRAWTPPMSSGLLPGTMRAELIAGGGIRERVLMPEDLRRAEQLFFINSVRRRVPLVLVD